MKKNVIIVTEGGRDIGFGHVTRCLSLCQAFEEKDIRPKIVVNGDEAIGAVLSGKNYEIFDWLKEEEKLFNMVKDADIAIIDSYLATEGFYKKVSECVNIPAYIDDSNRLEYPRGFVINGTIYAEDTFPRQKKDMVYLLGCAYIPLRKDFWAVPKKKTSEKLETVVITFGGEDSRNMTPKVLELLVKQYPDLNKKVVIGKGFRDITAIEAVKDDNTEFIHHPDADKMCQALISSDIAISAGGQTLYELARVGIPAIAVAIADNQIDNVQGWHKVGFSENAGFWKDAEVSAKILEAIEYLKSKGNRFQRSTIGKRFVDGKGSLRVRDILIRSKMRLAPDLREKAPSGLLEKAISSKKLVSRSGVNKRFAEKDFTKWTEELIKPLFFTNVMDVCCGTGNQLVLYAKKQGTDRMVGVDASQESLDKTKERLKDKAQSGKLLLKLVKMEKMFREPDIKTESFDLISCFYGLYYAEDPKKVIADMIDRLKYSGTALIVGPYGKNNADFFALLQRHYELPELVVRSATTFMENEVYPALSQRCDVKVKSFVNRIKYPNPQSLMDYWGSSTFYSPEHEDAVRKDIEEHFAKHKEYIIEKHVLAYIARRQR